MFGPTPLSSVVAGTFGAQGRPQIVKHHSMPCRAQPLHEAIITKYITVYSCGLFFEGSIGIRLQIQLRSFFLLIDPLELDYS